MNERIETTHTIEGIGQAETALGEALADLAGALDGIAPTTPEQVAELFEGFEK